MKTILIFSLLIVIFLLTACAHAALMYSSDEIRGTVVDGETDQPIEGAVVSAYWTVTKMILAPIGDTGNNKRELIRLEAVSDKAGKYVIPAWGPKLVSPLEVMESNSANIALYKIGYWNKYLSDIETEAFVKQGYGLSKVDDKQLLQECRYFSTQFERAVSNVARTTDSPAPSHRRSIWNSKTIRMKRIIPGEELRCGEKVMLCEEAKKKYGEDIKCDGPYYRMPIMIKVTEDDLYDQISSIFKDKNTCRDILKEEPRFSQESFKKYPLRKVLKECRDILKEDGK